MQLKDRVVLITGASSGIGLAIAQVCAAEQAKLVLTARSVDKLENIAAELADTGAAILVVPGDVTREANCRAVVAAAVDVFGTVDVLINSAGYAPPASLLETTETIWDTTLDVCLKGAYLMTRASVAVMLAHGGGTIVNISSIAGKHGYENLTAYCAAKWGLHGFTEALRAELGDKNIRAYLVCPGAVATPWWDTRNDPQPAEILQQMIRPEEVAEAVRWLLTRPERLLINEIVINTAHNPWEK